MPFAGGRGWKLVRLSIHGWVHVAGGVEVPGDLTPVVCPEQPRSKGILGHWPWGRRTFDALDLLGSETSEGPLVLGPRDTSRPDIALDIDDGGPRGGPSLATGQPLRVGGHRFVGSGAESGE